jgi:archaellum component FlaC
MDACLQRIADKRGEIRTRLFKDSSKQSKSKKVKAGIQTKTIYVLCFGRGGRDNIYPSRDHKFYVEGRSGVTNEEAERTMQFILEHQAQITVNIERITEKVEQVTAKVEEITEKEDRVTEKVDKLTDAQLKYEERTGRLEESFLILVKLARSTDERTDGFSEKMNKFDDQMNEFGDKMNMLVDAQIRSDKNIKNLMTVVERHDSEGRNGKT